MNPSRYPFPNAGGHPPHPDHPLIASGRLVSLVYPAAYGRNLYAGLAPRVGATYLSSANHSYVFSNCYPAYASFNEPNFPVHSLITAKPPPPLQLTSALNISDRPKLLVNPFESSQEGTSRRRTRFRSSQVPRREREMSLSLSSISLSGDEDPERDIRSSLPTPKRLSLSPISLCGDEDLKDSTRSPQWTTKRSSLSPISLSGDEDLKDNTCSLLRSPKRSSLSPISWSGDEDLKDNTRRLLQARKRTFSYRSRRRSSRSRRRSSRSRRRSSRSRRRSSSSQSRGSDRLSVSPSAKRASLILSPPPPPTWVCGQMTDVDEDSDEPVQFDGEVTDVEIVVVDRKLTNFAVKIKDQILSLGLTVGVGFLEDGDAEKVVKGAAERGSLFACVLLPELEAVLGVRLYILHEEISAPKDYALYHAIQVMKDSFASYEAKNKEAEKNVQAAKERCVKLPINNDVNTPIEDEGKQNISNKKSDRLIGHKEEQNTRKFSPSRGRRELSRYERDSPRSWRESPTMRRDTLRIRRDLPRSKGESSKCREPPRYRIDLPRNRRALSRSRRESSRSRGESPRIGRDLPRSRRTSSRSKRESTRDRRKSSRATRESPKRGLPRDRLSIRNSSMKSDNTKKENHTDKGKVDKKKIFGQDRNELLRKGGIDTNVKSEIVRCDKLGNKTEDKKVDVGSEKKAIDAQDIEEIVCISGEEIDKQVKNGLLSLNGKEINSKEKRKLVSCGRKATDKEAKIVHNRGTKVIDAKTKKDGTAKELKKSNDIVKRRNSVGESKDPFKYKKIEWDDRKISQAPIPISSKNANTKKSKYPDYYKISISNQNIIEIKETTVMIPKQEISLLPEEEKTVKIIPPKSCQYTIRHTTIGKMPGVRIKEITNKEDVPKEEKKNGVIVLDDKNVDKASNETNEDIDRDVRAMNPTYRYVVVRAMPSKLFSEKEKSQFNDALCELLWEMADDIPVPPTFLSTFRYGGILVVKAVDSDSQSWLIRNISKLKVWKGYKLIAVATERLNPYKAAITFKGNVKFDIEEIMVRLEKQNQGCLATEWYVFNKIEKADSTIFYVFISQKAKEYLKKVKCKLCFAIGTATVKIYEGNEQPPELD